MESIQLLGALRTEGFGALRLRAASAAAERIMCSRDCDGPSGAAGVTRWRRLCRSSTERFYVSCNNNSLLFLQLRGFLLKLLPATAEHFHLDHQLLHLYLVFVAISRFADRSLELLIKLFGNSLFHCWIMRVLSWRISSTSLLLESTVSIAKRALESRSRKAERNLHHHHRTDILLNRNHSTCHRCNRTAHQYCS